MALRNKFLFWQISGWNSTYLSGKLKPKVKSTWFDVFRETQFCGLDVWDTWSLRKGNAKFGRLNLRSHYWRYDKFFLPKSINMVKCILPRWSLRNFTFIKKLLPTNISECLERPHFATMVASLDKTNFSPHLEYVFDDFLVIR